jgi:L-glyceraldehyde 3-phosphate reductase
MRVHDFTDPKDYIPDTDRYQKIKYRRSGRSGILLPEVSLGLWHNFGYADNLIEARSILRRAFDLGITHFDLANNYGPPFGAAEEAFAGFLKKDFLAYRDQLIISTKAGYDMWDGPYGDFGSRKYLIASLDQSLKRMGLDYVDIFYHHRPDPETPLLETMLALDQIVRSGKALYVGISNYPADLTLQASEILKELNTPFLIHQARYSMLDRWVEDELLDTLSEEGVGLIAFSPLAQGLLSDRYINGIPEDSRAAKTLTYLGKAEVEKNIDKIRDLNKLAKSRGQSLSQMAISWLLKDNRVTSVLIGVSSVQQLEDNHKALENISFSEKELKEIDRIIK